MEKRIRSIIKALFRMYGTDKASEAQMRENRIASRMNDLASHPTLEKELDSDASLRYFVVQTILCDIPLSDVVRVN